MDVREKTSNEKRLIDVNALKKVLLPITYALEHEYGNLGGAVSGVIKHIDSAPTIDAVPVVRCLECKHWEPSGSKAGNSFSDMEYIGGCEFTNYYRRESDFCSYGERKEGAD